MIVSTVRMTKDGKKFIRVNPGEVPHWTAKGYKAVDGGKPIKIETPTTEIPTPTTPETPDKPEEETKDDGGDAPKSVKMKKGEAMQEVAPEKVDAMKGNGWEVVE